MARFLRVGASTVALWEARKRTIPGPVLLLLDLFEQELKSAPFPKEFVNPPFKLGLTRAFGLADSFMRAGARRAAERISFSKVDATPESAVQLAIARQVVSSLNEAKGLPVKIGQMLSYFDFHMPFAVREIFASLRNEGLPINPLVVARIIQEDFGQPPSQLFAEWETTPFAAASIGQVHRARLKSGERVAVKVQYPGIRETIESDLDGISLLGRLSSLILRIGDAGTILEEIREHLRQKCDYLVEANHQERFAEIFKNHHRITIPKVFRQHLSKRVLVTEYFEGASLEDFAGKASQTERNLAGEALWDYFNLPKYQHRLFNCDPHAGKFIFTPERVVCLDFGSIKRSSEAFTQAQKMQSLGAIHRDRELFKKALSEMKIIKDPVKFDFDAHWQFISRVAEPFGEEQPFQCAESYRQTLWNAMQTNPNKNATALPKEEVMAVRCFLGELAALATLRPRADWRTKMLSALK